MRFKVLLLDDEPGALEGMQLWIDWEGLGYEICGSCSNGAEGLQMIRQLQPDVVLTDIHMPVMNGLEMIERWQAQDGRPVRFVILSGYSDFEYARRALRYNVTDYLLKPLDEEEAERELRAIHLELLQEAEQRRISAAAAQEQSLRMLQEAVLRPPADGQERQRLERLSCRWEAWKLCLVHAERDEYDWAKEQAAALLHGQEGMYLLHMSHCRFGIVLGHARADDRQGSAWRAVTELAQVYADRRVQIACGSSVLSLHELHRCHAEAEEALRATFYCPGDAGAVAYLRGGGFLSQYDQAALIHKLLSAFMLLDAAAFRAAVAEAARLFRSQSMAPEIVKKVVIHLWYEMHEYVREHGSEEAAAGPELQEPDMPGAVESLLRLEACMERLQAWGETGIALLKREQRGKLQGAVQVINAYIKEHYREALTIKQLSEVFYLHPTYLGQLLIKHNGIGFNELLHNLRIEEAASLLSAGKHTNSEVAERVGYISYSQFVKQFEKRLHISPGKYKKSRS